MDLNKIEESRLYNSITEREALTKNAFINTVTMTAIKQFWRKFTIDIINKWVLYTHFQNSILL